MNRIVLIKEGEYRPSLFADFAETVNQPAVEQVGFYSRHDYTFRLTRNRSTLDPTFPIAVAHYNVDVACEVQDPKLFRPIDTASMFKALDKYDYVMFGAITQTHLVTDINLLATARFIARNSEGKLVDAFTDEVLQPDDNKVTFVTTFLGMVRMKGLPVYAIILNPTMTHVTDGFDYYHASSNTMYSIVSDHDGTIKDTVFAPNIRGARLFGETLLVHDFCVVLTFFTTPSVLRNMHVIVDEDWVTIDTNLLYRIEDNTIIVFMDPNKPVAHFSIRFNCGTFFDVASIIEQPQFNYLIIANDNSPN